ncbi:MAG: hypothetical protein AAF830_14915 [Pseudomonadota bacterium]
MSGKESAIEAPEPIVATLPPLPEGLSAVTYQVLATGELAVLVADRRRRGGRRIPRAKRAAEAEGRIFVLADSAWHQVLEFSPLPRFSNFDAFPDGNWLIVNVRTGTEPNGRVISPAGDLVRTVMLGDGIEHVKIDDFGRIWVGWFDEGVFSNNGWYVDGLSDPPNSYGVAAFSAKGRLLAYPTGVLVADCYALTTARDEAWFYPYTDFPIVRLSPKRQDLWPTELSGTRAIAVREPYVLAVGGYGGDFDRAVLLELEASSARELASWSLPLGPRRSRELRFLDARGDTIWAIVGDRCLRWTVDDAVAAAAAG